MNQYFQSQQQAQDKQTELMRNILLSKLRKISTNSKTITSTFVEPNSQTISVVLSTGMDNKPNQIPSSYKDQRLDSTKRQPSQIKMQQKVNLEQAVNPGEMQGKMKMSISTFKSGESSLFQQETSVIKRMSAQFGSSDQNGDDNPQPVDSYDLKQSQIFKSQMKSEVTVFDVQLHDTPSNRDTKKKSPTASYKKPPLSTKFCKNGKFNFSTDQRSLKKRTDLKIQSLRTQLLNMELKSIQNKPKINRNSTRMLLHKSSDTTQGGQSIKRYQQNLKKNHSEQIITKQKQIDRENGIYFTPKINQKSKRLVKNKITYKKYNIPAKSPTNSKYNVSYDHINQFQTLQGFNYMDAVPENDQEYAQSSLIQAQDQVAQKGQQEVELTERYNAMGNDQVEDNDGYIQAQPEFLEDNYVQNGQYDDAGIESSTTKSHKSHSRNKKKQQNQSIENLLTFGRNSQRNRKYLSSKASAESNYIPEINKKSKQMISQNPKLSIPFQDRLRLRKVQSAQVLKEKERKAQMPMHKIKMKKVKKLIDFSQASKQKAEKRCYSPPRAIPVIGLDQHQQRQKIKDQLNKFINIKYHSKSPQQSRQSTPHQDQQSLSVSKPSEFQVEAVNKGISQQTVDLNNDLADAMSFSSKHNNHNDYLAPQHHDSRNQYCGPEESTQNSIQNPIVKLPTGQSVRTVIVPDEFTDSIGTGGQAIKQ